MFLDDSLFELSNYHRYLKEWTEEDTKIQEYLLHPEMNRSILERKAEYVTKFYQENISRDKRLFVENEEASSHILSALTADEYARARVAFFKVNELFEKLLKQLTYYAGE